VREEVADLRFAERVGRLATVFGELTDGSHVSLAGALGESGEPEVLKEALAESGHGRLLSADFFLKEGGFSKGIGVSEAAPSQGVSGKGP
jgi:hypothetical protein